MTDRGPIIYAVACGFIATGAGAAVSLTTPPGSMTRLCVWCGCMAVIGIAAGMAGDSAWLARARAAAVAWFWRYLRM